MSHLDQALLDELKLVLEDEFVDLISAFIDDSNERMKLIRQQFEQQDWTQLSRTAHSFKGSAGNIGAQVLADMCMALEDNARDGNCSLQMIEQVDQEQASVCQQLKIIANNS
ncbi:Hpt domain-containing protein [Salinibius halmophilus]|uniref:Hpt domain-containing protein n=1 Tax=Salinibius halmophilus TaxID=1853216 RepID=UPI000E670F14|nr:Hpt domain-containing protein [Salinibius halmophilus]